MNWANVEPLGMQGLFKPKVHKKSLTHSSFSLQILILKNKNYEKNFRVKYGFFNVDYVTSRINYLDYF